MSRVIKLHWAVFVEIAAQFDDNMKLKNILLVCYQPMLTTYYVKQIRVVG